MNDDTLARVVPYVLIHAQAEAPKECCGLVIVQNDDLVYVACGNLARDHEHFVIDGADYARAEDTGRVVAIAHSHPYIAAEPSLADRSGIERTGLPWLIVNVPVGSYTITRPSGFTAPLIGRPFVHGVHDCYALVRDWYASVGVTLGDYARSWAWWEQADGPDLYRDNFEREGFEQIENGPLDAARLRMLAPNDLLLMNIRAAHDNHMAVYLGDGVILHHLIGQLSRREALQEFYQRRTTAILRHRAFMAEPQAVEE